ARPLHSRSRRHHRHDRPRASRGGHRRADVQWRLRRHPSEAAASAGGVTGDRETRARRLREAGDSALLLELEPRIDAEVNARAIAIADAVRKAAVPGVRDVVPTYRSVAVFFDPLHTVLESVTTALEHASEHPSAAGRSRLIEVPVAYGGENGPDL